MFSITTQWESLDFGTDEEKAAFARLGLKAKNHWLTEGQDELAGCIRKEPLLSAYHFAEWLAWNWWRLRYESKPKSATDIQWMLAHNMAEIGGGYIWPHLIMLSDGYRLALISKPGNSSDTFRYLNSSSCVVRAVDWEASVDDFITRVLNRLDAQGIAGSNLLDIWQSVLEERDSPSMTGYRKLEAMLGYDPDEAPEAVIRELIWAQKSLGTDAVYELAASQISDSVPQFDSLQKSGSSTNLTDRIVVDDLPMVSSEQAAWHLGAHLAKKIRKQLGSIEEPITNKNLAEIMAVSERTLSERSVSALQLGYTLKINATQGRVSLSGSRETGRRFELARLLADSLLFSADNLALAASSSTYRQKMQRAFAAELLCPFDVLVHEIGSDISQEQQENLAEHFMVSPLTVKNILTDNGLLERSDYFLGDTA